MAWFDTCLRADTHRQVWALSFVILPKIRDWFLEKGIFNKEMRKKLRKTVRIIPYEVPACRQAGMFYDNSLKLGKKRPFKTHLRHSSALEKIIALFFQYNKTTYELSQQNIPAVLWWISLNIE